jgi:hypothetical protein
MGPQRRSSYAGELIGATSILALKCDDQPFSFETGERLVERPGSEANIGESLDVLGQGVAVLGPVRKAGEDEGRRTGVAPEPGEDLRFTGLAHSDVSLARHLLRLHRLTIDRQADD